MAAKRWLGVLVGLSLGLGGSAALPSGPGAAPAAAGGAGPLVRPGQAGPPAQAEAVLSPDDGSGAAQVDPEALRASVGVALADPALGRGPALVVLDGPSGEVLFDAAGDRPVPPASSTKMLTATAALHFMAPSQRFRTSVVGRGGDIVLVGGGDATLTQTPDTDAGYPEAPSLEHLAKATAKRLRSAAVTEVRLGFDDSLFSGPDVAPGWFGDLLSLGIIAPVSALTVRASTGGPVRVSAGGPAATATEIFAEQLRALGLSVQLSGRSAAPPDAPVVASVQSGPLTAVLDRVLARSDNIVAEAVLRQAGLAAGGVGSFAGGLQAVRDALTAEGLDSSGLAQVDGSGLSKQNRVPTRLLAQIAARGLPTQTPDRLDLLPAGLPVGGSTGTLADRFLDSPQDGAAGHVLAKTGTLTGITSLTGLVRTRQGRILAFALVAPRIQDTLGARAASERVVARIAACGCT